MVLDTKFMHSDNGGYLPLSLIVPRYVFTPTFRYV